ncbi:hypothetical protein [Mocis latipes granulovirus]|uniref:Uncharacterized protein n=1 Tax=Mocis latipes granulovirus TaxID=2072024 RepID=A0A161C741_9BBAC|nr:hypothetical protein [Mocis latipes granulovirus]AKR17492.1 hypothetical protein [Mocis latipes granulovirus]
MCCYVIVQLIANKTFEYNVFFNLLSIMVLRFLCIITHLAIPINCYTFVSNFVGYTTSNYGLCLGNCIQVPEFENKHVCVINYEGKLVSCTPTNIPTKLYRTITNKLCYSNCGYFDGESYEWCVVKTEQGSTWDYCTTNLALEAVETVQTDNKYMTCGYTTCSMHNRFSYNWCGTIGTYWEYCDPNNKVLLINYKTYGDTECASPCELSMDDQPFCYDVNYDWASCYLNPSFFTQAHNVYQVLNEFYRGGGVYTLDGYKRCIGTLYRIENDDQFNNFVMFKTDIRKVALYYADNNPTVALREKNWRLITPTLTTNPNPITAYTVLPIDNKSGAKQLNLPLAVHSIITNYTRQTSDAPTVFNNDINRYMTQMDFTYIGTNYDEVGYIVGHKLGGPSEKYNMFPQTWKYKRGDKNKYKLLEDKINTFLLTETQRYVDYVAILVYRNQKSIFLYRPVAVGISVRLYNANNMLVDFEGNHITRIQNDLENMYFSNDPTAKCLEDYYE